MGSRGSSTPFLQQAGATALPNSVTPSLMASCPLASFKHVSLTSQDFFGLVWPLKSLMPDISLLYLEPLQWLKTILGPPLTKKIISALHEVLVTSSAGLRAKFENQAGKSLEPRNEEPMEGQMSTARILGHTMPFTLFCNLEQFPLPFPASSFLLC